MRRARLRRAGLLSCVLAAGVITTPAATTRGRQTGQERPAVPPELWMWPVPSQGTPAADEDSVYLLTRHRSVVALDRSTGRVRWTRPTGPADGRTLGVRVVTLEATVIAGDDAVVAFDRATGHQQWRFDPGAVHSAGLFLGGSSGALVFTGSAAGHVFAIDHASGARAWSARVGDGTTVFAPVATGDLCIAAFTTFVSPPAGGLVALDAATGRERWRRTFPPWTTPTLGTGAAGEPLIVGSDVLAASQDGTIYAFAVATGGLRWVIPGIDTRPDGRVMTMQDARPVGRGGSWLVTGSLSGQVIVYDLETRRERWRRVPVAASVAFGLAVDDETTYVPYLSGHLVALNLVDGRERWRVGPSAGLSWVPLVHGEGLYAAGSGGVFAWLRATR